MKQVVLWGAMVAAMSLGACQTVPSYVSPAATEPHATVRLMKGPTFDIMTDIIEVDGFAVPDCAAAPGSGRLTEIVWTTPEPIRIPVGAPVYLRVNTERFTHPTHYACLNLIELVPREGEAYVISHSFQTRTCSVELLDRAGRSTGDARMLPVPESCAPKKEGWTSIPRQGANGS